MTKIGGAWQDRIGEIGRFDENSQKNQNQKRDGLSAGKVEIVFSKMPEGAPAS